MEIILETERLILRKIKNTDVPHIFKLDSNPKVHQYLGNNPITTIQQAEKNVAFIQQQYQQLGIGRFACVEKATKNFIGWAGLKLNTGVKEQLNGYNDFVDIGYRLIPEFWRKGYALEAATACLHYGFTEMEYPIIYGAADVNNIGSNKILKKIGLHFINEFEYHNSKVNWYELKKSDYGL